MTVCATVDGHTAPGETALDERILGAGTTQRFVLLLLLFVAGSMAMTSSVVNDLFSFDNGRWFWCALADGFNPAASDQSQTLFFIVSEHDPAMTACAASATIMPFWLPLAATAMLVACAYGLYRLLPAWKGRSSRAVLLSSVDPDGALRSTLDELVATAGLAMRPPRVVLDPTATTMSAVVFGTRRHATIRLNGGLLAIHSTRPERFRAVVLHELAHIYNRDIFVTYATVAMWRVFLAAALLPEAVLTVRQMLGNGPAVAYPVDTLNLAQECLIVVLVYLARADILRRRELHADLMAARWGANRDGWLPPATRKNLAGAVSSEFGGRFGNCGARTHPGNYATGR